VTRYRKRNSYCKNADESKRGSKNANERRRICKKLISAAELAPPMPVTTLLPSTAPKKKLPRAPSMPMYLADAAGLEASSGLKFPEFRGAGVYLRSQRMKLPQTLGQKKAKAIEQSIEKLGIEPHPMASDEIVTQFNDLRSDIILLFDLKSALAACEFELEALRHEYQAVTGKDLEIPSRLHLNSDAGTSEGAVTSPFKRRIADALDVTPGPMPPRKRKAVVDQTPALKKMKKL